jgi:hypothetical protein
MKDKLYKMDYLIALSFILIAISLRLVPHLPNFNPIAAIALFGGVYLTRKVALILPLIALAISDYFIGYYEFSLMASVYGSFLLCVVLGFWLKRHKKWYNIGGSAVVCSVLFFLVTNFTVWAFTSWYPHTFTGLVQCFTMALPFFRNTILGDLFHVGVFFGVYEIAKIVVRRFVLKEAPASIK